MTGNLLSPASRAIRQKADLLKAYRDRIAELDASFDAGIERNRKEGAIVRVVDRGGKPVPGAHLALHQKTHDFRFGCNGLQIGQKGELNQEYEREFARLFNLVTTTVCWSVTEIEEGKFRLAERDGDMYRRPPLDRIVAFGKKYGIRVKGQPLMADSWWPDWTSRDADVLKRQWSAFVRVMGETYADKVDVWDVVNEAMQCPSRHPDFPLLDKDYSYVDWCFAEIGRVFPKKHGVFELNEATNVNWGNPADTYFGIARRLVEKGLPLQQIGFQFHMTNGKEAIRHLKGENLPLASVLETYRKFSALGLPLAITEITIPSRIPDFSPEEGEALQAEIARNLYRMWFSLPAIDTITYWNLMDGAHWMNEGDCRGCLLDVNMKEKPVYHALYQLIQREWKTSLDAQTDEKGEFSFRGFCGEYALTAETETRRLSLPIGIHHGAKNEFLVTL